MPPVVNPGLILEQELLIHHTSIYLMCGKNYDLIIVTKLIKR